MVRRAPESYSRLMCADRPIDIERIREAIKRCPSVGSDSWTVGLSIKTRDGREIEGEAIYLADPDTAVLSTNDGEMRVAVAEITDVFSRLASPGPE